MQSNTEAVFSSDDESPNAMVARAQALVPELRRRQAETENAGYVLPDAIQALLSAGLYRVVQPKKFGGLEFGLDNFVRVAMTVASGCGSTGWVFSTGAQHQWQIGLFPEEAQEEVWGEDPTALAASA